MLGNELEWTHARIELYKLHKKNPTWTQKRLAEALGYSVSWVKKWLKRAKRASVKDLEVFTSQSRAPKNPARKVTERVRDVILTLRQKLTEKYKRVAGAYPILYHLHHDGYFKGEERDNLPRSTSTIWQVLKDAGYIPEKVKTHVALEPSEPMDEWEFDFGTVTIADDAKFEIAPIIDRGTSILIDIPAKKGTYQADTTLEMLIDVFREHGYPNRFRFDRDPRLIGSVGMDDFPSALMRFAWCIGMEPVICPPRRPDLKPYIERSIRTIKHEKMYVDKPATEEDIIAYGKDFLAFYNYERAHQGFTCQNQPPMIAHPDLPALNSLPQRVNPDRWVDEYHMEVFKRHVSSNGAIQVDNHVYHIGKQYALKTVTLYLNAITKVFQINVGGVQLDSQPIKGLHQRIMDFDEYAELMIDEARAIARKQR
jgi:DNA-binding MarR family transcriptional regulator